MPDGVLQWYDERTGEGAVVRGGQLFTVGASDMDPSARRAGARVHFDIRRESGIERAIEVHLRRGRRVSRRHTRVGDLTGARRPDDKVTPPAPSPRPDPGPLPALHPIEVLQAWTETIARGDRDAGLSLLAPYAVVHLEGGNIVGRREIGEWIERSPAFGCAMRAALRGVDGEFEASWPSFDGNARAVGVRCAIRHGFIDEVWPLEPEPSRTQFAVESLAGPAMVETLVQGDVAGDAVTYAQRRIGRVIELVAEPVLFARVKLSHASDPARQRPEVVEVMLDINGDAVRAQVAASTMFEAIDILQARLRDRIEHRAGRLESLRRWSPQPEPGEWRRGDLPSKRPEYFDRPPEERVLVRLKTFATEELTPDEAIFDMEQLGYDFYLFRDLASGGDSLVERSGDDTYVLTPLDHHEVDLGPYAYRVMTSTKTPPAMTVNDAMDRLNTSGEPYVFFQNVTTLRGNVCYHRYDGNYGLITPQ